jgi:hypothetical protein
MSKLIKKNVTCEACDSAYEVSHYPGAVAKGIDIFCHFCGAIIDGVDEYIDEDVEDDAEEE